MRNLLFLFSAVGLLCLSSCDDGDVFTVEFDFSDTFEDCGNENLVFYKTKNDPTESLSVLINNFTLDQILSFTGTDTTITRSGASFNYRTYSNASLPSDLFCSDIPTSDVVIVNDYPSTVSVEINASLIEDDQDGILAEFEGQDPNGDGDFSDAIDTDNDGIPNYLDEDDDGDNVLTKNENPDPNGDGNPDDAQNTDGQDEPDYLDTDDDGDMVLTRDEENDSQNQNPRDDVTFADFGPDYLNPNQATTVGATAYREHTIFQTYTVLLTVRDISIEILSQDVLDFGVLNNNSELNRTDKVTPVFN